MNRCTVREQLWRATLAVPAAAAWTFCASWFSTWEEEAGEPVRTGTGSWRLSFRVVLVELGTVTPCWRCQHWLLCWAAAGSCGPSCMLAGCMDRGGRTLTGFCRLARCNFFTFDVIVAEKSIVWRSLGMTDRI